MRTTKTLLLTIVFALISLLLTIFGAQSLRAQSAFYSQENTATRMDSDEVYWQSFDLGLTEAQQKKLESLLSAYASEAFPLSMEIMSLRFELRYLIRDSSVQPKILLDRQKKILELQTKLDDLSLSYRIKARSVFIKEQLEQLPPDFLMGMEHGSGVKVGGSRQ